MLERPESQMSVESHIDIIVLAQATALFCHSSCYIVPVTGLLGRKTTVAIVLRCIFTSVVRVATPLIMQFTARSEFLPAMNSGQIYDGFWQHGRPAVPFVSRPVVGLVARWQKHLALLGSGI